MTSDFAALLAAPFCATMAFIAIHTYFGLHVLRRKVVFADLALAQLSALGATLAVALGHAPGDPAAFGYAMLFALSGAGALTLSRAASRAVSQEAFVGILYVAATAATVLVIDRAPQGAEHVKRMLVGTLLDVGPAQLAKIIPLYLAIAALHWVARRRFLDASEGRLGRARSAILWDFAFYASFGAVVTSSVAVAGVLLVFSLLIIPAVTGMLFARGMGGALLVGWGVGVLASIAGFATSVALDLPTGACLVLALAAALGIAGLGRGLCAGPAEEVRRRRTRAYRIAATSALLAVLAGGLWSLAEPTADQPLLAALERVGLRPELFMRAGEADSYAEARATEQRYRAEVEALSDLERRSRWQEPTLTDDDVRRIASYQQTYNEMGRGERFVQEHLRASARARERWLVSLPLAALSSMALMTLLFGTADARQWRISLPRRRGLSNAARRPAREVSSRPNMQG
jgi:zinc/manganese transport system permease protein